MSYPIGITEKAKEQLNEIAKNHEVNCIRIKTEQKGCSGHSYKFEFDEVENKNFLDEIVKTEKVNVIIDGTSLLFLLGSTLDWREDGLEKHFIWQNPNEKSRCGCGESFSI